MSGRITVTALVVLVACVCHPPGARGDFTIAEARKAKCRIVIGREAAWPERYAAEEMSRYVKSIADADIPISPDDAPDLSEATDLVLIGRPGTNRLTGDLEKNGLLKLPVFHSAPDGFVIKTLSAGGKRYLVLCGSGDIGTLYSVYHFLETFCGVGFFQDGERVSQMDTLTVGGIDLVEEPRFKDRKHNAWVGHLALKKYHSRWWSLEDWKREIDWMVKRKLNMLTLEMCAAYGFAGVAAREAFPEIGGAYPPILEYVSGWPAGWDWPAEYRTELTKAILDYGRKRGVRFVYTFWYGNVPPGFREKHPDLKYLYDEGYGTTTIHPEDPKCQEYAKRYLSKVIEIFGTDHLYFCTPYSEVALGEDPLRVKIMAAEQICQFLKEIDPKAIWLTDSWDFRFNPKGIWTSETVNKYLKSLPRDMVYMYDTCTDMGEIHKTYDYFHGINWAFGVLHSYAGDDHLHGDIGDIIAKAKAVASDPRADNCIGFHMNPEMTHANIMYYHLLSKLAWEPEKIEKDSFLKEYVSHRYSEKSVPSMYESYTKLAEAMPDITKPIYRSLISYRVREYPVQKVMGTIPQLNKALDSALAEKENQRGNVLYENYLVDLFRAYAGDLSSYHLVHLRSAFRSGDRKSFELHAERAMECLDKLEVVLSARPDFSLEETIDEAIKVKGANPHIPEIIRASSVVHQYNTHDTVELVHHFYARNVRDYVAVLRDALVKGDSGEDPPYGFLFKQAEADWIKKGAIGVGDRFKGTATEAIEAGFSHLALESELEAPAAETGADLAPKIDMQEVKEVVEVLGNKNLEEVLPVECPRTIVTVSSEYQAWNGKTIYSISPNARTRVRVKGPTELTAILYFDYHSGSSGRKEYGITVFEDGKQVKEMFYYVDKFLPIAYKDYAGWVSGQPKKLTLRVPDGEHVYDFKQGLCIGPWMEANFYVTAPRK